MAPGIDRFTELRAPDFGDGASYGVGAARLDPRGSAPADNTALVDSLGYRAVVQDGQLELRSGKDLVCFFAYSGAKNVIGDYLRRKDDEARGVRDPGGLIPLTVPREIITKLLVSITQRNSSGG